MGRSLVTAAELEVFKIVPGESVSQTQLLKEDVCQWLQQTHITIISAQPEPPVVKYVLAVPRYGQAE